jgi:hypothetical protein
MDHLRENVREDTSRGYDVLPVTSIEARVTILFLKASRR